MSTVRLVGTGPGHPGLVTIQAVEAIREADSVRHREGCARTALSFARPGADVAAWRSEEEILELARSGRSVAILYPGDPYALGDGSIMAERLDRAGIDFEAIPGMLVEISGPLLSGIPLTVEGKSASIRLGNQTGDTVVLRVSAGWLEAAVHSLVDGGRAPSTAAALLIEPGTPAQRRLDGTLAGLAQIAADRGLRGDALLVVGPGVSLANRLDTLSRRPLHLRRVLVTRPRHQSESFRRELIALGAIVAEIPTIEIRPVTADDQIRQAIEGLPLTGLIVFTSSNAVDIFFDLLFEGGRDARSLHASKICAIGPETARSLEDHGVRPELVAGEYTAEGLAEALQGWPMEGVRVLVPRARVARDALPVLLAQRGAEVEILPVYETVPPQGLGESLEAALSGPGIDVITFSSSSTVTNFVQAIPEARLIEILKTTRVACMGPVTAATARKLGMRVDIIARDYTTRGLAAAIAEAFS